MRAMRLSAAHQPLRLTAVAIPTPAPGQVLIRVHACAVCRTDLHVVDGELTEPKLPLIPGHEIVGTVAALGDGADRFAPGDRVGVPWLGFTCGVCDFCRAGRENLCARARFTGYQIDGGYADYTVADQRFCFAMPEGYSDVQAAPLLCAGLIGYRALRMAGDGARLGLYGFGAAAHIIAQVARWQGRRVFAFTSPGDTDAQDFARELGAVWAGGSDQSPPELLDAAIIFAPVGPLVPAALRAVERGGTVVCAGIHMSPIPSFSYDILWGERVVRSVANLTRRDGDEFLALAPKVPVVTRPLPYALEQANQALDDLRAGKLQGAAVLVP
ncbi:MAG: zinc-dependent alcohol dehydrogenase family protein [Acetobacteraceae bacterium]